MALDGNKSEIGKLNDKLYSRTKYKNPVDSRKSVDALDTEDVKESWDSPDLNTMLGTEKIYQPSSHPIMKKVFVSSLVFFVLAIVVAGYVFFGGSSFISSKNVDINIIGPTSVSAGEVLELGLTITNRNNAPLESAQLSIQYPEGARSADDSTRTLTFTKEDLGSVDSGGESVRNIKAILLGSKGEVREVKFSVEYKVRGSSATFYKEKVYEISIGDSPLSLAVEGARLVNSGDEFQTTLTVILNSEESIKGVMIRAEYPYGYSVLGSTPESVSDSNVWYLGDFSPGDKKTVVVRGRLVGEHEEERTFRYYVGVSESGGEATSFRTNITATQSTVAIARPSVDLNVSMGADTSDTFVIPTGKTTTVSVRFRNNLPEKIVNPLIETVITGQVLNKSSVSAMDSGVYDSLNNKITWRPVGSAGANELAPGDSDAVSFRFESTADLPVSVSAREIKIEVTFTGTPIGSLGGLPIVIRESKVVKVSSQASLTASVTRSQGPFQNIGPIPPKAEEETTYSIRLRIGNTSGDLKNGAFSARLGSNVKWVGATGDIAYNDLTNTVTWDVGDVPSGSGFSSPEKEIYFQVALLPSVIQIGTTPTLVNNISFTALDTHTASVITATHSPLTTRLIGDPTFVQGDDIVVQ